MSEPLERAKKSLDEARELLEQADRLREIVEYAIHMDAVETPRVLKSQCDKVRYALLKYREARQWRPHVSAQCLTGSRETALESIFGGGGATWVPPDV